MESPNKILPFDKDSSAYLEYLGAVAEDDVRGLAEAEKSYGNSWKKRGGIGAFMMLARKWDRLEKQLQHYAAKEREPGEEAIQANPYDIFEHVLADTRAEGVIDDIRDLRRYLMLVEAELRSRGAILGKHRDNEEVR